MRWPIVMVTLAALGCGAAWAQASPAELEIMRGELSVQREIADSTYLMMVTSAISAVFAFLSFVGVVITLRAQRNLTYAQEAAFLAIHAATFKPNNSLEADRLSPKWAMTIRLTNNGRTLASNAQVRVRVAIPVRANLSRPFMGLHQVAIGGAGEIGPGESSDLDVAVPALEKSLRYFESAPPDRTLVVEIGVTFRDVFGRSRNLELTAGVDLPPPDSVTPISIVDRGRYTKLPA